MAVTHDSEQVAFREYLDARLTRPRLRGSPDRSSDTGRGGSHEAASTRRKNARPGGAVWGAPAAMHGAGARKRGMIGSSMR